MEKKSHLLLITATFLLFSILLYPPISALPTPTIEVQSSYQKIILSQEQDYNFDGIPDVRTTFTDIGNNVIEIFVNQTNLDKKYKWASAFCNLDGLEGIKLLYEDSQGGFTNAYPINPTLYDFQWTHPDWCIETNHIGYSLFGSGAGNKRYRMILPEGNKKFKIFTGQNSEEILYEYEEEVLLIYNTPVYDKDDFEIELSQDGNTTLDIDWVEINGTNLFYPRGISLPTNAIYFKQNILKIPVEYNSYNQYYSETTYKEIGYQKFEEKNNITNKTIIPVYEYIDPTIWQQFILFFKSIFGYEPEEPIPELKYYLIKYEGDIVDLDPELVYTYTASPYGFYTNTTATASGIRLTSLNTTGNFTSFVFHNSSELNWSVKLGHNASLSTQNISLQTRTATSYNTSDINLRALYSMQGYTDEKGLASFTTSSGNVTNETFGVVGMGTAFTPNTGDNYAGGFFRTTSSSVIQTGDKTISMWVYPREFSRYQVILANGQAGSSSNNGVDMLLNGNNRFGMTIGNGGTANLYLQTPDSGTQFTTSAWYHVVGVQNSTGIFIFVNNKMEYSDTSAEGSETAGDRYFIVGCSPFADNTACAYDFNGAVDEIRIYNRSLTATEISDLYNLGSSHINWNDWSDKGNTTSGQWYNTSSGKFLQFNAQFKGTNATFLHNHTIASTSMMVTPPTINITYPIDGSSITYIPTEINYTYTKGTNNLDSCWYSTNVGVTNSTPTTAGLNFTGVSFIEGESSAYVWCNDTDNNLGSNLITFFTNLPPTIHIHNPISGSIQDLVFLINFTATNGDGIDTQWWSIDGETNRTYNNPTSYFASVGTHTIIFYANDTYGAMNYSSSTFTTKNETDPYWTGNWTNFNECPTGTEMYGIYENGSVKCRTSTATTTTIICPENIFGYYNPNLPSIKKNSCIT